MNASRIETRSYCIVLLAALMVSACVSSGQRFWTEFAPTFANFERHFAERGQDLDPIEGIWRGKRTGHEFVIVGDTRFEGYEYVGLHIPEGEIFMALRRDEGQAPLYTWHCYELARERSARLCGGTFLITAEGELQAHGTIQQTGQPGQPSIGWSDVTYVRRSPSP